MTHTAVFSPTGRIRGFSSRRSDEALTALESRTAHSWLMALDRAKVLPDLPATPSAAVRLFIKAAAGAHVTDMDGTRYVDLCLNDGAQILGHAPPVVQRAIVDQSARGWHFDLPGESQLELARLIQSAGAANERVALCSSGNEALHHALRAARAFTGKAGIGVFRGAEHGKSLREDGAIELLPANESAALERVQHHKTLAAVLVEAVSAAEPGLDRAAWLHELALCCRNAGILLILDERLTGFRLAYGGAQEIFGLIPDLVVYGKTVGGGLPLGAVAGHTDIMKAGYETDGKPEFARVPSLSPLSVTAGIATLDYLHGRRAALYPALNETGRDLAEHFNAFAREEQIPAFLQCAGSMFRIKLGSNRRAGEPVTAESSPAWATTEASFNVLTLSRGILMLSCRRGFLSTAHTRADIGCVTEAFQLALRDLRDDGLFAGML